MPIDTSPLGTIDRHVRCGIKLFAKTVPTLKHKIKMHSTYLYGNLLIEIQVLKNKVKELEQKSLGKAVEIVGVPYNSLWGLQVYS